ncbi:mCG1041531 [Mus musculus]|nr:mCG1041531 [Mus musculus]
MYQTMMESESLFPSWSSEGKHTLAEEEPCRTEAL